MANSKAARIGVLAGIVLGQVLGVAVLDPTADAQTYAQFKEKHKLPMIQRSVLPEADGRLGRMAFDEKSGRLYIAAKRSGSLQAMDPTGLHIAQNIKDIPDPSGVEFMSDARLLAVACGDGTVRIFSADDKGQLTHRRSVQLRGEAYDLAYDAKAKRLWVSHGKNVSWIDPEKDYTEQSPPAADSRVKLPEFAKGIALHAGTDRLYVSMPDSGQIAVIDTRACTLAQTWTIKDATGNYAVAVDAERSRVFAATQEPPAVVALDSATGKEIARVGITGGAETLWYDAQGTRLYAACASDGGKVAMILQKNADSYELEHQEPTMAGAGMSVLLEGKRRLIVTAPKLADQPTFVYFFLIPP